MIAHATTDKNLNAIEDLSTLLSIGWDIPTEKLASGIISGDFTADLVACFKELSAPASFKKHIDALVKARRESTQSLQELYDCLRTDHTMMFDFPQNNGTWPYESQQRDQDSNRRSVPFFISRSAVAVKDLFDEAGVTLPAHEPPDHIAREFEFIALCAHHERSGSDKQSTWSSLRKAMGTEHLRKWVDQWSQKVVANADTDFYRIFAGLTSEIVESNILWKDAQTSLLARKLPIFPL